MGCRVQDLKNKQVVSVKDGAVIGFVHDVEINTIDGSMTAVIILGRPRFFGIFGREDDIIIPWKDIEVIGQETILVSCDTSLYSDYKKRLF